MTKISDKYELLVKDLIKEDFDSNLFEKSIYHNKKYLGKSGHNHQIDIATEINIGSINLLIIVECKYYSKKIGIKEVLELSSRIRDISANKGVLVSTIGFQKGAITYAKANRIALIKVYDGCYVPCTGGGGDNPLFEFEFIDLFKTYFLWFNNLSLLNDIDPDLKSKINSLQFFYQYKAKYCETKFNGNTETNVDISKIIHQDIKKSLVFSNFCYSFIGSKFELDVNNNGLFNYFILDYLLTKE